MRFRLLHSEATEQMSPEVAVVPSVKSRGLESDCLSQGLPLSLTSGAPCF